MVLPVALVACALSLACQREPRPPQPPNAHLALVASRTQPLEPGEAEGMPDPAAWDTEVVARVESLPVFGETHEGDRTTYWMLVTCRVSEVRRGAWPEGVLRFVNRQTWVQAGYKLHEYGPRLYYDTGWVFRFGLRHAGDGGVDIVYQQRQ